MSDEWEKVEEEGQRSWWHPTLGGVVETDDKFVATMPYAKIVKLGPFDSLEEAQAAMEPERVSKAIEIAIEALNLELLKR